MPENFASQLHPHEPEIPPALGDEGRCLVCGLLVERDALREQVREQQELLAAIQECDWSDEYADFMHVPPALWERLVKDDQ